MAIGTGTAMLLAAAGGAAANAYSGNKASKAATEGAQAGADAQLQAAREANALQQRMFDTTWSAGAPWRQAGEQALGNLQGFMGMTPQGNQGNLATSPQGNTPTPVAGAPGGAMQGAPVQTSAQTPIQQAPGTANPSFRSATPWMTPANSFIDMDGPGTLRTSGDLNEPRQFMQMEGGRGFAPTPAPLNLMTAQGANPAVNPAAAPQATNPNPAPQTQPNPTGEAGPSAFDQFLNSTNYQFTADQGNNALSRLLARTGHLGSGRGQMAAIDYNQNMAHSNAIMPYMNQLNLMSGLGQNSAMQGGNQAMQAGGIMGNNIMQGGMAAGNALAQGGMNRASAYQNTGNAIGNLFNQYGMWRGYQAGLKGGGP